NWIPSIPIHPPGSHPPLRCVSFGSCQERKLFPTHCAPNRLGNKLSLEGAPHRGPGCYDNHVGTILYDIQKRPESKKGYTLAARTSARFLPCAQLFLCYSPGTYAHDTTLNRKVSWPMKFGSPDWGRLPTLERKALRTELLCDKEFAKQRSRVAYLQLFYS
uniref:Si:ch211-66i15.4 n=1 Tax=Salmo trutta TaxID=8032 RepID=A0A673X6E0_SALTR